MGNPHITAKVDTLAPLSTSTKLSPFGVSESTGISIKPTKRLDLLLRGKNNPVIKEYQAFGACNVRWFPTPLPQSEESSCETDTSRSPSTARLPFFGEGLPTKIVYSKKGTLILNSLLEDRDLVSL